VDTDLEAQRPRNGSVESRQFFDHLDGGANGVLGTPKPAITASPIVLMVVPA
jgi:hypothetical protein